MGVVTYLMIIIQIFILSMIALVSCDTSNDHFQPTPHQMMEGKSSYVIDGGTFYFSFDHGKVKVRLSEVDVPDMKEKNGFESYEFLRNLIHQKTVKIEFLNVDSNGRWIANVNLENGENVQEKVRARNWITHPNH